MAYVLAYARRDNTLIVPLSNVLLAHCIALLATIQLPACLINLGLLSKMVHT